MNVDEELLIKTKYFILLTFNVIFLFQKKKRGKENVTTDRLVIINVLHGNHDSWGRLFLWQQPLVSDDHRQIVDLRHFIVQTLPQVKPRHVSDEELVWSCSS